MTKEFETEFVQKEIKSMIDTFERRSVNDEAAIEKITSELMLSKYGSYRHVTKMIALSTLSNYKLRLTELIEGLNQIKDLETLNEINGYIENIKKESETELENNTKELRQQEMYSAEYVNSEILTKSYHRLVDLYSGVYTQLDTIKKECLEKGENPTPVNVPVEKVAVEKKKEKE